MYSARLLDHFEHPRNSGDLPEADVSVTVENPACGDVLQLSMKTNAAVITAVRFKAKGCVPAMACGSAITELIAGKSFTEAGALNAKDVVSAVDGLPPASGHAADLAIDALRAALQQVK